MANRILKLERSEWWFWLKWVLASAVGWVVGWHVGELLDMFAGPVYLNVGGLVFGTAQWIVLRKRVDRSGQWVLASSMGWLVGSAVGWFVFSAVGWLMVGAAVGIAQWIVLRRRVYRSGFWALASVVGWVLASIMGWVASFHVGVGTVVAGLVVGLVAGAITGLVLITLLRHPIPKAQDAQQGVSTDQGTGEGKGDRT
jgi:hypothetical protein